MEICNWEVYKAFDERKLVEINAQLQENTEAVRILSYGKDQGRTPTRGDIRVQEMGVLLDDEFDHPRLSVLKRDE
jgi:hypothetical protein